MDAVILAAGTGSRMKADCNKVFLKLCEKEVLLHTLEAFERSTRIDSIIIVTGAEDMDMCRALAGGIGKVKKIIAGGKERQESSMLGVQAAESDYVMIHDGARALISVKDIDAVADAAEEYGAAAVGFPCVDTMKRCTAGQITETVDRENLYKIYTPQCFQRERLLRLHMCAKEAGVSVTDDCALYEWGGENVQMVVGDPHNIKLTTPEDMCIAEAILNMRSDKI